MCIRDSLYPGEGAALRPPLRWPHVRRGPGGPAVQDLGLAGPPDDLHQRGRRLRRRVRPDGRGQRAEAGAADVLGRLLRDVGEVPRGGEADPEGETG
eukprot:5489635-Pyramimonas_sp.AAC.1